MSDEKQYPMDPAGQLDAGVESTDRMRPCAKRTWCSREVDHGGNCEEVPPVPYERQDWDKRTPDPRGWADVARTRSRKR